MQPTVILVHGAFAESSSWDGVIDRLLEAGHPVVAAANPLRGLPPTPPPSATWPARWTGRWCSSPTPTAAP
jgi:pimeloyl-ACP methyl ester carboxylesterase